MQFPLNQLSHVLMLVFSMFLLGLVIWLVFRLERLPADRSGFNIDQCWVR